MPRRRHLSGSSNYQHVLRDDLFRIAFARTALFVALVVPFGNILSLLLAVGLTQDYRGTTIYKTAFYLPVVTSVAVVALLWRWLYSAEFGLLNYYLQARLVLSDSPWEYPLAH